MFKVILYELQLIKNCFEICTNFLKGKVKQYTESGKLMRIEDCDLSLMLDYPRWAFRCDNQITINDEFIMHFWVYNENWEVVAETSILWENLGI